MAGDKGGGSDEVEQITKVSYPRWWRDLAIPVLKDLGGIYGEQAAQPLHPLSEQALQGMAAEARAGSPLLGQARGAVGDVIGSAGLAPEAAGLAGDLISGAFVNPAFAETQRIAMGGDAGSNPYLAAAFERASRPLVERLTQEVNPTIDIGSLSAGRGGSGMHALLRNRAGEQTGQALTDLATNIFGGAYESDQARRMAALGQLGALGQQDVANRVAGAGLFDTGTARALQASGLAPALDATRFTDAERLLGIGRTMQSAPFEPAERYLQSLYGFPGISHGGITTSSQPGTNPLVSGAAGALGGAGTVASIAHLMPSLGWGGGALGIGAGLGGLFGMLSDERSKRDIRRIGITLGGTPLYAYRYKDEYGGGPTQIGALAQEVLETQPDAVTVWPDAMLGIDYSRLQ